MLTYCLELQLIASLDRGIIKDEAKAVKYIADTIRNLGYPAATYLPRSTRERPDYSFWNVCLDVTILEETSSWRKIKVMMMKKNSELSSYHLYFTITRPTMNKLYIHTYPYQVWKLSSDPPYNKPEQRPSYPCGIFRRHE